MAHQQKKKIYFISDDLSPKQNEKIAASTVKKAQGTSLYSVATEQRSIDPRQLPSEGNCQEQGCNSLNVLQIFLKSSPLLEIYLYEKHYHRDPLLFFIELSRAAHLLFLFLPVNSMLDRYLLMFYSLQGFHTSKCSLVFNCDLLQFNNVSFGTQIPNLILHLFCQRILKHDPFSVNQMHFLLSPCALHSLSTTIEGAALPESKDDPMIFLNLSCISLLHQPLSLISESIPSHFR